jgi:hypothetical protein
MTKNLFSHYRGSCLFIIYSCCETGFLSKICVMLFCQESLLKNFRIVAVLLIMEPFLNIMVCQYASNTITKNVDLFVMSAKNPSVVGAFRLWARNSTPNIFVAAIVTGNCAEELSKKLITDLCVINVLTKFIIVLSGFLISHISCF